MTKKTSILFIGNSFTTRNNLPELLSLLLAASPENPHLSWDVIAAGGASLRRHLNAGEARRLLEKSRFDFVVLQEQSTLPIKNRKRFHQNVREFVPHIESAGAKPILYETWARVHEPENQELLTEAYAEIGAELGVTVVPAGSAWAAYLERHRTPALHAEDGSHPTPAGSYLAACVFGTTLYNLEISSIELSITGLGPAEEALIRKSVTAR